MAGKDRFFRKGLLHCPCTPNILLCIAHVPQSLVHGVCVAYVLLSLMHCACNDYVLLSLMHCACIAYAPQSLMLCMHCPCTAVPDGR